MPKSLPQMEFRHSPSSRHTFFCRGRASEISLCVVRKSNRIKLGQPWMGSWILQSFAGISTNQISPVFFGAGYPRLTMNRDVGYHRESNLISKSWSSCSRLLCHCGRLYLILRHIHTYIYMWLLWFFFRHQTIPIDCWLLRLKASVRIRWSRWVPSCVASYITSHYPIEGHRYNNHV